MSIFSNLTNLENLDLHNNRIETISNLMFLSLHALRSLNLSNNCLKEFPSRIFHLKNLQKLNLSSNKILEFPPADFDAKESQVEELNISGNDIIVVPGRVLN